MDLKQILEKIQTQIEIADKTKGLKQTYGDPYIDGIVINVEDARLIHDALNKSSVIDGIIERSNFETKAWSKADDEYPQYQDDSMGGIVHQTDYEDIQEWYVRGACWAYENLTSL